MKYFLYIILLINTSCSYIFDLKSDSTLCSEIQNEFESNKIPVNLSTLTKFEWDNYLLLQPYSNIESIEKRNNLDLQNIRHNKIEKSDFIQLLVFIKDKKSIKICELNRIIELDSEKRISIKI